MIVPMTGAIVALMGGKGSSSVSKKDIEEAAAKAIRKEIDHQRTLEAKAWVKKQKEVRQREEAQAFWEWFKEEKDKE